MKLCLFVGVVLFSLSSLASELVCEAQKSVMKFDASTGKIEVRRAVSSQFQITTVEHDDPKIYNFVDESGASWGSVQVVTGTNTIDNKKESYVNATVTTTDGAIRAFVLLKLPEGSQGATASSLVFDDEEMPPSLTIRCTLFASK